MKFLICSTDENQTQAIIDAVEIFCNNNLLSNESFVFRNSVDAAVCRENIDIAIVDVELNDLNGIALSKILKKTNPEMKLIVIASCYEMLNDAFDLESVRYLIKPVNDECLNEGLTQALRRIKSDTVLVDLCDSRDRIIIKKSDILIIEIKNRKTRIVTYKRIYNSKLPMKFWLERLQTSNFFSPHKSYIINFDGVVQYKRNSFVIMKNGENVPIARSKGKDFNAKYNDYQSFQV